MANGKWKVARGGELVRSVGRWLAGARRRSQVGEGETASAEAGGALGRESAIAVRVCQGFQISEAESSPQHRKNRSAIEINEVITVPFGLKRRVEKIIGLLEIEH
ncbi:MAG: hypothetical protein C5B50_28080 [Verrucomicrobia bacterium]|nr:MAG: hypothetical protein C5B50_28080 [Verrucomicrobiota bacterium]